MAGPVVKTNLACLKLKNVFFPGTIDYNLLPAFLSEVDLIILPYRIIPFSQSIFPAKIFECLASGKPIVATAIRELMTFAGLIHIARTHVEFIKAVEAALSEKDEEIKMARRDLAAKNSWENRFTQLHKILRDNLEKKGANI
jgi:glycosyltransferase involved in cell wall biosynthesis